MKIYAANAQHILLGPPSSTQAQEKEVQLARVGMGGSPTKYSSLAFSLAPTKGKPHPSGPSIWRSFRRLVVSTVTKGEGLLVDKLLPHPHPPPAPSLWPPALTSVFLGFP